MALSTLGRLHKFTEREISLGQAIANQLGMAVENSRLMQDLYQRNIRIQEQSEALSKQFREQTILLEISKALSQTLDLKKLFEIVTKKTTELLGIEHCAAMIIDAPAGDVILYTAYSNGKYLAEYKDIRWNLKDFPVLVSG